MLLVPLFRTAIPAALVLILAGAVQAQAPATCTSAPGVLLAKHGAAWRPITAGQPVPAGTPVVALFDATLRSGNGDVGLRLLADPAQRGPLPILESAVVLRGDAGPDLALTPLRGLLVLTNLKKQGPATVRFTSHGDALDVTLKEPGAKLAVELYSRHAPGSLKLGDPKADEPVLHLFIIALHGEVILHGPKHTLTLHAPPGPAVVVWDSLLHEPTVERLETLPPEIATMKNEDKKLLDAACAWARKLADESPATILREGANSASSLERRSAVIAMGALDDLPSLLGVLAGSKHADARAQAVLTLRHWLGREPGQTARLDAALRQAGYSAVQAENVLQLLYGFTPAQRRTPSTYELLLADLQSSHPAVRELAHWHLVRLAPAGRSIPYDALAPATDRQRAVAAWRQLIPAGELPHAKTNP